MSNWVSIDVDAVGSKAEAEEKRKLLARDAEEVSVSVGEFEEEVVSRGEHSDDDVRDTSPQV
jgi:hypothetical protein